MKRVPTSEQFANGLRRSRMEEYDYRVLELFMEAPRHSLTSTDIAGGFGVNGHEYGNLRIGTLGAKLAEAMDFTPNDRGSNGKPMYWNVIASGEARDNDDHFVFTMHAGLVEALASFPYRPNPLSKKYDIKGTPIADLPPLTEEQQRRIDERRAERRKER